LQFLPINNLIIYAWFYNLLILRRLEKLVYERNNPSEMFILVSSEWLSPALTASDDKGHTTKSSNKLGCRAIEIINFNLADVNKVLLYNNRKDH